MRQFTAFFRLACLSLIPSAAACSIESRSAMPGEEAPDPARCEPGGGFPDFDGDGVPLPCDALVELPEGFALSDRVDDSVSLSAGQDTVALPNADGGPIVISGNRFATQFSELQDSHFPSVAADSSVWFTKASRVDVFATHLVVDDQFFTVGPGGVERSLHYTPHSVVVAESTEAGTPALHRWVRGESERLDAGITRVQSLNEIGPGVLHLSFDESQELVRDTASGFESLLRAQSIGVDPRPDPRGGHWWCVRNGGEAALIRRVDDAEVERRSLAELGHHSCDGLQWASVNPGEFWVVVAIEAELGALWHWPDGAAPRMMVERFDGGLSLHPTADRLYLRGSTWGPLVRGALYAFEDGQLRLLHERIGGLPQVHTQGEVLGMAWREPEYPGASPHQPVTVHALIARGGEATPVRLQLDDIADPGLRGVWLAPDGAVWMNVEDGGQKRIHVAHPDGTTTVLPLDVGLPEISWQGEFGLLSQEGPESGVWAIEGTTLRRLDNSAGRHHILLRDPVDHDPYAGLDAGERQWVAYARSDNDHVVATWSRGRLRTVAEGLSSAPRAHRDSDGQWWLALERRDQHRLARVADGDLETVFDDMARFRPVSRWQSGSSASTLLAVAFERDARVSVCRVAGAAAPTCLMAPPEAMRLISWPTLTETGQFFAVVSGAGGRRYVWRPRQPL